MRRREVIALLGSAAAWSFEASAAAIRKAIPPRHFDWTTAFAMIKTRVAFLDELRRQRF